MSAKRNTAKEPDKDDALRVFKLRCKSKSGGVVTRDEIQFCMEIADKYPEWYESLDAKVFEATKPFGAR